MDSLPFHDEDEGDQDQTTSKQRRDFEPVKLSYKALQLNKFWFASKSPLDVDEELTLSKYKAHAELLKTNFTSALELYNQCADLLPQNANLLQREVYEGKAKCLIELERLKEAEDATKFMLKQKGNPQDSSLWSLLSSIYERMGDLKRAVECLKKCLDLHPEYPEYWIRLANVYSKLASRESYVNYSSGELIGENQTGLQNNSESVSEGDPCETIWHFVGHFLSLTQKGIVQLKDTGLIESQNSDVDQSLLPSTEESVHKETVRNSENDEMNIGKGSEIKESMADLSILDDDDVKIRKRNENKQFGKEDDDEIGGDSEAKSQKDCHEVLFDKIKKGNVEKLKTFLQAKRSNDNETCESLNGLQRFQSCCLNNLILIYSLKKLFPEDELPSGNIFQGLEVIEKFFNKPHYEDTLVHGRSAKSNECQDLNIDGVLFVIWKTLMLAVHCCSAVTALIYLRRSVQGSKGFAKKATESKLAAVEKCITHLLPSKSHVQRLAKVLEHN